MIHGFAEISQPAVRASRVSVSAIDEDSKDVTLLHGLPMGAPGGFVLKVWFSSVQDGIIALAEALPASHSSPRLNCFGRVIDVS